MSVTFNFPCVLNACSKLLRWWCVVSVARWKTKKGVDGMSSCLVLNRMNGTTTPLCSTTSVCDTFLDIDNRHIRWNQSQSDSTAPIQQNYQASPCRFQVGGDSGRGPSCSEITLWCNLASSCIGIHQRRSHTDRSQARLRRTCASSSPQHRQVAADTSTLRIHRGCCPGHRSCF